VVFVIRHPGWKCLACFALERSLESATPFNLGASVTPRIEINLFFETGLYLMLFASSAGGV